MYICEICEKVFDNHRKLNGHKKSHSTKIKIKYKIKSTRIAEANKIKWKNPDNLQRFSQRMKQVVKDNPDSYSTANVSGRVKKMVVDNLNYGETTVTGNWERIVAEWLNMKQLKWTNKIKRIEYNWNDSVHLYFPDFYLEDLDIFIEVKGYQRDRDLAKWKSLKNLVIIKQAEITAILNDNYNIAG